jgi:hypothetical protein
LQDEHIALYAYQLPDELGIQAYAIYLSSIFTRKNWLMAAIADDQSRIKQLENAERYNLDTTNIIRETMRITLEKTRPEIEELSPEQGQPVLAAALNDALTALDETQIRAIEWVLIAGSDDLRVDSLANGNIVFRRLLCTRLYYEIDFSGGPSQRC